ncbi:(deoxy)nucleoside triphosphate pyrophosphohydrolase [Cyclobacterium amurskyense]|mgnify:FL=1|uniref:8-oxo-dGTP diphosphatase n=1 Tax=Cyclobacterium amurskyense TaxID=320787 RepID=A0A0H4PFR5_9BACT|nr:(deoxy)nucleoside triphosphate pyrophosphohydrolase [Cyclobacterium amurskyense]AKP53326.1 NUDIX hydrolase [Cyclobacterium amurskyense]|tara:strand:- start:1664 stop:2059 length:396 start_codon:yes stop_codon:yes gene_type:complete
MKSIEVVAGIIFFKNQILCVQRPESKHQYISKKFEFPGGKVEPEETKIEALQRELLEELNIIPAIKSLYLTVEHTYPDFKVTMHGFLCEVDSKALSLREHISQEWLKPEELNQLDWAAADIPIVQKLQSNH